MIDDTIKNKPLYLPPLLQCASFQPLLLLHPSVRVWALARGKKGLGSDQGGKKHLKPQVQTALGALTPIAP